ncbi:MAG: hypothetical protein IPI60_08350 [Saprospiraceae bacterium]|nr:hypothetical protein [Saprospiraceae bacterium]
MFKAKLIANPSFVFFRKHAQLLHFIAITFNVTIINVLLKEGIAYWVLILAIPAYLITFYAMYLIGRKVMNAMQDRRLELDFNSIRIVNKGGVTDFEIAASSIETVNLQKEYKYAGSFGKELLKQIRGDANYHFIQVNSGGQWFTMRFMLDSLYMEYKINEVIQYWISLGIPIAYTKDPVNSSVVTSKLEVVK